MRDLLVRYGTTPPIPGELLIYLFLAVAGFASGQAWVLLIFAYCALMALLGRVLNDKTPA